MKNFKRISAFLLAMILCLSLCALVGCDGDGEDTTGAVGSDDETTAGGTQTANEYSFVKNNFKITPHGKMSEVLTAIGQPLEYLESPSCYYQGLDKDYKYAGFTIRTYPENDVDYVLNIKFTDDSVETPEGILLGSSSDDVISAYGSEYTESAGAYIYVKGNTELRIYIRDGGVTGIEYWALEEQTGA